MRIWVDIEGLADKRVGAGPFINVIDWTHTVALDQVGAFSLSVPASDPKASLLRPRRVARAWVMDGLGNLLQIGAGRIEKICSTVAKTGAVVLTATGPDLLGELTQKLCFGLNLVKYAAQHPTRVYIYSHETDTNTSLTNSIDYAVGDTTTFSTFGLYLYNYMRIRAITTFDRVSVVLGTSKNTVASTLGARYYNGAEWKGLVIVDGTSVAGRTFAQSGDITFTVPEDWATEGTGITYEIQLFCAETTDSINMCDLSVWHNTPNNDVLNAIMAYAPITPPWSLDAVNGYT